MRKFKLFSVKIYRFSAFSRTRTVWLGFRREILRRRLGFDDAQIEDGHEAQRDESAAPEDGIES